MKYIVHNTESTKGVIIEASEAIKAVKLAHSAFYGAFSCIVKKDLTSVQPLSKGKNYPFSVPELKKFDKVQFDFNGNGSAGVTTSYNTDIYIEPNERQREFIGKATISFVKFWNGDDLKQ